MHIQHAPEVSAITASQIPSHRQPDSPAGLEDGTISVAQLVIGQPSATQIIVDMRIGAQLAEQQVAVDEGLND